MSFRYTYTDMHTHYIGFIQQTQGLDALYSVLQSNQVNKCVLFSIPFNMEISEKSNHDPQTISYTWDDSKAYYHPLSDVLMIEDYIKWKGQHPTLVDPFIPFLAGGNTVNENTAAEMQRVLDMYKNPQTNKSYFKGIGEVMFRHDYLTWKVGGVTPRVDSRAAINIFNMAGRNNMVTCIHHDITSCSQSINPIYLEELQTALANCPNSKIIWAHCGMTLDMSCDGLLGIIQDMLDDYPNLYVDISWVVWDYVIVKNLASWAAFIGDPRYNNRFMIGTDLVGSFDNTAHTIYDIRKYDTLLGEIERQYNFARADNVAQNNFNNLIS